MTTPTVLRRWADSLARNSSHCAVKSGTREVTYQELAGRVAGYQAAFERIVGPADPVLLSCADPVEVIAAVLGCTAAGRTFAPVDPRLPAAVLDGVLAALRPGAVVADAAGRAALAEHAALAGRELPGGAGLVRPETLEPREWSAEAWQQADPEDRGYVYFTSGTTGRPKGIRGSLRAVRHFVDWEIAEFGIGEGTRVSQLTSPGFDAFLRDAFTPLCAGGTVCVNPAAETPVGDGLARWLTENEVEVLHCVPTLFRTLRSATLTPDSLPALRAVLLAGEQLHPSDVAWWRGLFGGGKELVNLYGPSETTMTKLFHRTTEEDAGARLVPAGRPLPGVAARVLTGPGDPPDALGEVELEVPYPLLGYLGEEEWRGTDTTYRTGDLGRFRPDGALELYGRRDQQVKVHGVRIDLGEVENALRGHPGVQDACAAAVTEDVSTALVAYVVAPDVPDAELRAHAAQRLAPGLVPSIFVRMAAIPRTLNGKVERRSLPRVPLQRTAEATEPPQGPEETRIAAIWSEILGLAGVNRDDDFTLLGGDSLAIARLMDRVRYEYQVDLPLRAFLLDPTVAGLAAAVADRMARSAS
ncbi:non-ribosomal peptide synthetase [Kitasatospora sp. NPDC097691]|uniref:non-ribosomal peptide synthetase n=1 Tax=Kitasatospora sp. NPDC097691 TaxID=3157231 RepID=UPI00331F9092